MTQDSAAEQLRGRGGIGSQSQASRSSPPRPQGGGRGGGQPPGPRLPDGYLRDGYFDEKGNIYERLIVDDAINIANNLGQGNMSRSQLRNFYEEVVDIRHLIRSQHNTFDELRPRILKLKAFAHNATTQRASKAPPLFDDFISRNVELGSQSQKNFLDGMYQHFECVVLYFTGR